jgi:hypothetical protein
MTYMYPFVGSPEAGNSHINLFWVPSLFVRYEIRLLVLFGDGADNDESFIL